MSIKIQQPNPDQLLVTQDANGLQQLLGVIIAVPGLYLWYILGLSWYETAVASIAGGGGSLTDLLSGLPGTIFTLLFGGIFIVLGVVGFSWSSFLIDRKAQSVTTVRHFGLYRRQKVHSLTQFSQVEINFDTPTSSREKHTRFTIKLRQPKGEALKEGLEIATIHWRLVDQGVALTRQIADFLGYTFRSQIGEWATPVPKTTFADRWYHGWFTAERQTLYFLVQKGWALVRGKEKFNWQTLNSLTAPEVPDILLGRLMWSFTGTAFRSRRIFDEAVAAYQVARGSTRDEWEPDEIALRAPRVAICYQAPLEDDLWEERRVELDAENGEQFANSELLFKLHRELVKQLNGYELCHMEGLELLDGEAEAKTPCYRLLQVR